MKAAKKMLTAIIHLGLPTLDLPFLWNLALEVHRGVDVLLSLEQFAYLEAHFNGRKNPAACKLHYALASIEDQIIQDVEAKLSEVSSLTINTYIFDGLIVRTDVACQGDIENALHHVEDKW